MPKYRMTLIVDVESANEIQPVSASGNFDVVMEAMGALQEPLNNVEDDGVTATMTFGKHPQEYHGERIAERGRHNGTSEA
jgi:hypothetical protein